MNNLGHFSSFFTFFQKPVNGSGWNFAWASYGCQLWGQNENAIEQTITLQKKAVRLISFEHFQASSDPLFKNLSMLKLVDIVKLNNVLFTHNTINSKSPATFNGYFNFKEIIHSHQTVNSLNSTYSIPTGSLDLPTYQTKAGEESIRYICSNTWNTILKDLSMKNIDKYNKDPFWISKMKIVKLKEILKNHFLQYYWSLNKINYYRELYFQNSIFLFLSLFLIKLRILLYCWFKPGSSAKQSS